MVLLSIVISISVLALLFAGYLTRQILRKDTGTVAMQEVAVAVKIGAEAFLKRQYTTIGILTVVLAVIIYVAALQKPFGTFCLTWQDWAIVSALSVTVIPVIELTKWVIRRGWFGLAKA